MKPRVSRWGRRPTEDPDAEKLTTRATVEQSWSAQIKANPPAVPHVQNRVFKNAAISVDKGGTLPTICGLVVPFNQIISLGDGAAELYRRGCFDASLAVDDAVCLMNGNIDRVLGRKSSGTASFSSKPDGLHYLVDPPDCSWAKDLITVMRRGDINSSSAAILILKCDYDDIGGQRVRIVNQARLLSVGPSTFSLLQDAGIDTETTISNAKASGFRLGIEAGRTSGTAKNGELGNRLARLATPTNRIAKELQQRTKNA